jgi:ABC-type uncharacterized transport system fused permease/ATPase subunit
MPCSACQVGPSIPVIAHNTRSKAFGCHQVVHFVFFIRNAVFLVSGRADEQRKSVRPGHLQHSTPCGGSRCRCACGHSCFRLPRLAGRQVAEGHSLLIAGPSGVGKTSMLRAIAGLWYNGSGVIRRHGTAIKAGAGDGDIFFVPQRPYLVLGTLRDQLLYPTWAADAPAAAAER